MQSRQIAGLTLFYAPEERAAAEIIAPACSCSMELIPRMWNLRPPQDCRVYVMTGWFSFIIQSFPWPIKILYTATIPFWAGRVQRTWTIAGGWTFNTGRRIVVGVKPARLLETADRSIGETIFNKIEPIEDKIASITAHELTHAHTLPLRLPAWMSEGMAMLTADRLLGLETVKTETLSALIDEEKLKTYPAMTIPFIRGYWLTRYLLETQPAFFSDWSAYPARAKTLEKEIAGLLGIQPQTFWKEAGALVAAYFTP
ncbi:MAG: hypothetical protein JW987_03620 [Anaerolineaceae bacterium]|nr:hypothetical protein [Anaerolineaceae bacterium]